MLYEERNSLSNSSSNNINSRENRNFSFEDMSSVITCIENLNLKIKELHSAIETIEKSKDEEINKIKQEIMILKSSSMSSVLTHRVVTNIITIN